ncbi:hypothetical protein C5C18_15010 [Rathayibacter tritici]|uniref:hypothetical protein n=1 Tax=Rathayibacter tritici TaxID=33888 RepID=UPI000CE73B9F|nr:hypothetical protein [Rathayibacter tritici]PPF61087.1 hypothetical protein C5C21_15025 [Rathayibacter tritici]PPG02059.1 hypothetical protein C5C18_15010 [Rathayibacter tritici]
MPQMDALQLAAGAYTADTWDQSNWREFGRGTGMSDILSQHSRLYRSQDFGDDDYPDAALEVLGWILTGHAACFSMRSGRNPDQWSWSLATTTGAAEQSTRFSVEASGSQQLRGMMRSATDGDARSSKVQDKSARSPF